MKMSEILPDTDRLIRLDPDELTAATLVAASVASSGWPVVPLHPASRTPLGAGGENHRGIWCRTLNEVVERAEEWEAELSCRAGRRVAPSWGVVLGEPNDHDLHLIVLDSDSDDAEARLLALVEEAGAESWAAETMTVRTARGRHRYGLTDRPVRTGKPWPGFDLKAAGGYVVAPGNPHPSGVRYTDETAEEGTVRTGGEFPPGSIFRTIELDDDGNPVAAFSRPLPIPPELLDRLAENAPPATPVRGAPTPEILAGGTGELTGSHARHRLDGALRWLSEAVNGERNDRLNRAAGLVAGLLARVPANDRRGDLDPSEWRSRLTRAAVDLGLPQREAERTIASGWGWGASRPAEAAPDRPRAPETATTEGDGDGDGGSTWTPMDLSAVLGGLLDGSVQRPVPTVGQVIMGDCLLYAGKVNSIFGESGCGKSWTAVYLVRQVLEDGQAVVFIDLEGDPVGTVGRLLDVGAEATTVASSFHYVQPETKLRPVDAAALFALLDDVKPGLVVIDSAGEALAMEGAKTNSDEDVAIWFRKVPAAIAKRGPAVLTVDHVVKADPESLWPTGSQRKRAAVSGAAYLQVTVRPFSKDSGGYAKLVCAKDRHGTYRVGQKVAELHVEPGSRFSLVAVPDSRTEDGQPFRPTVLMEKVSRVLEAAVPAPLTGRQVEASVTGKATAKRAALAALVAEGFVRIEPKGSAILHHLVKPFRDAGRTQGADDAQ